MATTLTNAATWRDEAFPCVRVNTDIQNSLVITRYPHRKGQHVLNLGSLGDTWEAEAVFAPDFNGRGPYANDLYPYGFLRFIEACRKKERGYFNHPRFGTAWAQCQGARVLDDAGEYSRVSVTFIEANLDEPTYTTRLTVGGAGTGQEDGLIRATALDALMTSTFSLEISVFSGLWLAYMDALFNTNRVLTSADVNVELNIFHQGITTQVDTYDVENPLYWDIQFQISMLRLDGLMVAHRFGQAQESRVISYDLAGTTSSVELAVILYGDPDRAAEIERLNHVRDPLFMPPGQYQVMSE